MTSARPFLGLDAAPWFLSARGATCLRASAYLFASAAGLGAVVALLRGNTGPPPARATTWSVELLAAAAMHIAETNLRVVLWLLVGALLFGVPTVLVSVFNAFRLGSDLCTLAQVSAADAALMLLYVPLEYGGLVHAAAAALQIGSRIFCVLFGLPLAAGPPSSVTLAARACGLVLAGAVVEASAMYLRTIR